MSKYDNSESFSVDVKYQIQCFTINNTGDKIIVAGKTQYELYSIDETEFKFMSKLSLHRPDNLCIMDISWSKLDSRLVVSGGSNGKLYKLIVTQTEIIIDSNFTNKFHDRTINRINFHPNEHNLLLSGGQDGIIKLIDFRCPIVKQLTFSHDAEDKVTDIQFNPSHTRTETFASGSESGYVYIWDTRFPQRYERKLYPHLGFVHLDWHPDIKDRLATASRDKQICVYDLSNSADRLTPINTITHSESVTSIKWRPNRPNQITACSLDAHLYVWDLMRPYVPYSSFDQLTNKVQNFLWRNSPKVVIASTRDHLYNMNISDAIRPADNSTLVTIQMDKHGSVVFAVGVADSKKNPGEQSFEIQTKTSTTNSISTLNNHNAGNSLPVEARQHESTLPQQVGSYGSLSNNMNNLFTRPNIDSQSNESDNIEKFRITKSILYIDDQIKQTRSDWFYYAACNYKFKDKAFDDLCDHNAQVALTYKKFNIFKDWMILKTIYKENKRIENYKEYQNLSNALTIPTNTILKRNQSGSDSNLSHLNIVTSGFPTSTTVPNTLITIHDSTSSSSNSSSGTSISSNNINNGNSELFRNFDSSRIRNFSENSADDIIPTLTTGITPKNTTTDNLGYLNQNLNPYFNQSNNTNIQNNTLDNNPNEEESYYLNNNLIDKFVDEEDFSTLPSDIIEYNDDLSDDYFINDFLKHTKILNEQENTTAPHPTNKLMLNKDNNFRSQLEGNQFKLNTLPLMKQRAFTDFDDKTNRNQDNALLLQPVSDLKSSNEMIDNKDSSFLKNISSSYLNQNLNETLKMDFNKYFEQLLISYVNEENDLPTAVFMFLVATLNEKFDRNKIDPTILDEWFAQYIELLQIFELWNLRIEIIKSYQSDMIKQLTQKSINYNIMCSACKKTIKPNTFICPNCNHNIYLCVYCHLPVKRLFAWCNLCCHGGHLNHMTKWFKSNSKCPSGCGCKCRI